MGDESTGEPRPDPAKESPEQPDRPGGWHAGSQHEWEQRPNQTWQTGAPETWNRRPNDAWQAGTAHTWNPRSNQLWQTGDGSGTAPTMPLPETAPTMPQPTAPTEPLADARGVPGVLSAAMAGPSPHTGAVTPPSPPLGPAAPMSATGAEPARHPRSRTALWVGAGVILLAAILALIVVFSIWVGKQVESVWGGAAQPGTVASDPPPTPRPSAAEPTTEPTPPSTPVAIGERIPLDVPSGLPDGTDFALAAGSDWEDYGSTFLGGPDGQLWATSLTGISGESGGADASAAAEALVQLLLAGSDADARQSVWVNGADGRSYEFLAAEADGIGVMVRVEPGSGRQFALMYGATTAEVVANLVLE